MPVLKIMSRKKLYSIEHSLRYILRDGVQGDTQEALDPIVHNIRSHPSHIKEVVQEFMYNESYRKVTSNRVFCYHTIISLSTMDKAHCSPQQLRQLMEYYLELRGDVLAFGAIHMNTEAPHIHILESGTRYREAKSSRMSQAELVHIKLDLERFVEQELKLEHSKVQHQSSQRSIDLGTAKIQSKSNDEGIDLKQRPSKAQLSLELTDLLSRSESKSDFIDALAEQGYQYYERSQQGIPTGIIDASGQKHRFKTLHISIEDIQDLDGSQRKAKEQDLLDKLKRIRETRQDQHKHRTR